MLDKYLLIVSDNENSFTTNALYDALLKKKIFVKKASIADVNIPDYINDAFGVVIVDSFENTYMLNAIKKRCYETNKKVMLLGNPEELNVMKRVFVDSIIYKEYVRPVDIEEVIEGVEHLIVKVENQDIMHRILVVDDDGVFLRTVNSWLEGKYIVSLANSAETALKSLKTFVPELILLDYEMPNCSGAQFMELLSTRDNTRELPIIFLTSRCDEETVKEVMKLRPKGYILKTTTQDQIMRKIEDFFDSLNE